MTTQLPEAGLPPRTGCGIVAARREQTGGRKMRRWFCALALLLVAASSAPAQDFPNKPVRVIASSSAGGISDIFIRIVGEELHKKWGQPLVVENRPGGQFNIGAKACADSAPDGTTICILPSDVLQYNRHVFRSLNYDLFKDLEPVSLLTFAPLIGASPAPLATLVSALLDRGVGTIIVVDDGSGPQFAECFERIAVPDRVHVIHHAMNIGKGAALKTGLGYALARFPGARRIPANGRPNAALYKNKSKNAPRDDVCGRGAATATL